MSEHGKFYWNELTTKDPEGAKAFYGSVLGWTFEAMPMPEGTYWIAKADGENAGGIFPASGAEFENIPDHWLSYVAVTDAEACLAAVKKNGGTVVRDIFDVPDVGRIAIFEDSSKAAFGIIQPEASA